MDRQKLHRQLPVKRFLIAVLIVSSIILAGIEIREMLSPVTMLNVNDSIARIKPLATRKEVCIAIFGDNKNFTGTFADILNRCQIDPEIEAVIHTGDLVQNNKPEEYRDVCEIIRKTCNKPFLPIVGNHDISKNSTKIFENVFGSSHYTFKLSGRLWICLNDVTGLPQSELQWLKTVLKKNDPELPVIIIMHIPPIDPRPGKKHCLDDRVVNNLKKYLKKAPIEHIFAGHIHAFFQDYWAGIRLTITGGGGGRLMSKGLQHGFYHYLKVYITPDRIRVIPVSIRDNNFLLKIIDNTTQIIRNEWPEILLLCNCLLSLVILVFLWRVNRLPGEEKGDDSAPNPVSYRFVRMKKRRADQ